MSAEAIQPESECKSLDRFACARDDGGGITGTKDLLNPEFEPREAAKNIHDVKLMTISPGTVTGHASAGGFFPADVEFLNREVGGFLDAVTEGGKKLD